MLRDITIGRYVRGGSALHSLDPRTKIITALAYSAAVLYADSLISMALLGLYVSAAVILSELPVKYILNGLKPIRWFIVFTVAVDLIFIRGTAALELGCITVTYEGIRAAAAAAMRFIFLMTAASLLTLTTPPITLTDGFSRLIRPLSRIGVPTDDIAMIISVTLRSIPVFADEAERIMKAQRARGADFSRGGPRSWIKKIVSVTIPLLMSVLRRAEELSLAMDARCYGKGGRTPRKKTAFKRNDIIIFTISIFFCGILAIIEFYN